MTAHTTPPPSQTTIISPDPYHLKERPRKWHIRDDPITWSNWYKHINWLHTPLLIAIPFGGFYGLFTTPITMNTAIWSVIYYFITGLGITAGYHRLWAHRAYKASRPFEIFLILASSGAVQGSIRWWARDHRAHHRYTDTDKDPYSANKGLIYSHLGWMVLKQNPNVIGKADISDLNANPMIRFQHKYYGLFAITMGFIVPTLVAGLGWGDYWGGFHYAALLRLTFVHHATFCVNSLAHYLGETTFDDRHTPRDHFITAILSLGEGYHNFHHEFPQDYRNAIRFYQYDPTKWLIRFLSYFGLTHHLKKFPDNEIKKGKLLMRQKKLDYEKLQIQWGKEIAELPVFTFEEFQEGAKTKSWICIEGIIHDVSSFIDEHPGGRSFLTTSIGKDMTTDFNGGVYDHSNAARNLMSGLRVGVISGGGEVEHRKTK